MQTNFMVQRLGEQQGLDRVAKPLQNIVHGALAKMPIIEKALKGTSWLGHALHPALTDFPIGAWAAGMMLDTIELRGGIRRKRYSGAADLVHLFGFGTACLAAITGLADYTEAGREARRVGVVHGLLNVGVLGLYGASLLSRRKGRRRQGITLSTTGFGFLLVSGWLGRELSYSLGLGQTAERKRRARPMPEEPMPIAAEPARPPGKYEITTPAVDEGYPVTH